MKKIKTLLFIIPFVTLLVASYLGYENYKSKKPNEIHKVRVGYIEKSDVEFDSIKEYVKESIYGTYSGTAPRIYKGSKYQFKKYFFRITSQKLLTTTAIWYCDFTSIIREKFFFMIPLN